MRGIDDIRRQEPSPPRLAHWLLRRLGSVGEREVAHDLEELFLLRAEEEGINASRRRYWIDVLSICLRPRLRKKFAADIEPTHEQARGPIMWKNYLTTSLRYMRQHKGYSFINITGLAVGLACVLLIVLYVQHELSYDAYHEQGDHIYRVVLYSGVAEKVWYSATPALLAPELRTASSGRGC